MSITKTLTNQLKQAQIINTSLEKIRDHSVEKLGSN